MAQNEKSALARAASIGIEIGVAIIVCLVAGHWADEKLGTTPWLTLLGITLGTIVAMKAVLRTAKQAAEEQQE